VPGEKAAATQPFPTKPAPVEIQGVHENDLLDLTPELRQQALEVIARYDHGPLYTPPSERGTILMREIGGGPSWAGAPWDPETGMYYVTTVRFPSVVTLRQPSGESPDPYVGSVSFLAGPGRLPIFKPPWGSVVAIDMSTGEHRWRAPVGSGRPFAGAPAPLLARLAAIPDTPTSPERLGWPRRSFVLVTKSLLLVVQQGYQSNQRRAVSSPVGQVWNLNNLEPRLYAYDKASGRLLAEIPLPANAGGAPMTYMVGGKQYVAFSIGGSDIPEELIALSLP